MSRPTYSRVRTRSGAIGRSYPSFLDKEENKENYDPDTGEVSVAHSQYYLARNRPPVVPVTVPPTPSLVEKKPAPISLIERGKDCTGTLLPCRETGVQKTFSEVKRRCPTGRNVQEKERFSVCC